MTWRNVAAPSDKGTPRTTKPNWRISIQSARHRHWNCSSDRLVEICFPYVSCLSREWSIYWHIFRPLILRHRSRQA